MVDKEESRRRVRIAVKGAMSSRGWNIQQLIDASGLDRSTLGDFLAGERWPQSRTLGAIERSLDWPPGSIANVLEGGEPPAVSGPAQDAPQEEDSLLYRRPEGLTDQEWEQVKAESRGFIEWQIERAARER